MFAYRDNRRRPVFFGAERQWLCSACQIMNHELRRRCYNCLAPKTPKAPDRSGIWNDLCDVARMTVDSRPNVTANFVHATALHRFRWQRRQTFVTPVPNPQLMFYCYDFDNTIDEETGQ